MSSHQATLPRDPSPIKRLIMPSPSSIRKNSTKIRIEFTDDYGGRYTLTVEGARKEDLIKTIRSLDIPSPPKTPEPTLTHDQTSANEPLADTNFSRVYLLLTNKFKFGTFSSKDILQASREEMGLDLTLPTVSAYLTRLFQRGILSRTRNGASWLYRLIRENPNDNPVNTEPPYSPALAPPPIPETSSPYPKNSIKPPDPSQINYT